MDMSSINWLAVLAAGISAFVLGGVWYSPAMFGNAWMKANNLDLETIRKGNMLKIYGVAFILSLVMAANLAMFLADGPATCPEGCRQLPVSSPVFGYSAPLLSMDCLNTAAAG